MPYELGKKLIRAVKSADNNSKDSVITYKTTQVVITL